MKKALKISVIVLFLTALVVPAQAQRRVIHYLPKYENEPYHFGFLLAFNEMMYTIKTVEDYQGKPLPISSWPGPNAPSSTVEELYVYNIETKQKPGFTVGIIGSKRLGRYFDLRFIPTLSFCDHELIYDIKVDRDPKIRHEVKTTSTTFVEFPLNIKYRSKRYNNIGAYLMGGISPKIDLSSQKDLFQERYDDNGNVIGKDPINFVPKRFDIAAEIGVGYDFYNQWFKMGLEVKMSYGLLDIKKPTSLIWAAPIEKISNKMFQFSILIE